MIEGTSSGSIEIICGPMFSGKTQELIKRAEREKKLNKNVILFKPSIDNRYSKDEIVSHNKKKIKCNTIESAKEIFKYSNNADVLCIDEAQFIDSDLIKICEKLANQGKKIIIAGLDKDYLANPFIQMAHLMALSNNIIKLNAVCVQCGDFANFSKRISKETKQVVIGESEKYEARCRKCYYK